MAKETLHTLAKTIFALLTSDRDVLIAVGGFTGEGKSCFLTLLQKEYSKVSNTKWDFDNMTWSRKELLEWIDGKKGSKQNMEGLRENQKREYTAVMSDELFAMFYKRNWYMNEQINAITTFNMCRDRHLFIGGNVPDFWDLDASFQKRVRFYVYVPRRGIAWVFEQENNPFSQDTWNTSENKKIIRKKRNPYSCKNFICQIEFPDWTPSEKKRYYKIRNSKRHEALKDNDSEKVERYGKVKDQRNKIIRIWYNERNTISELLKAKSLDLNKLKEIYAKPPTYKDGAEITGLSAEAIRQIKEGII